MKIYSQVRSFAILLALFFCTFQTANAQRTIDLEEEELLRSFLPANQSPTPLVHGDVTIAFAWRMESGLAPNPTGRIHAIYVPGFEVQSTDDPITAGTLASYYQVARQLKYPSRTVTIVEGSDTQRRNVTFPEHLVEERDAVVWLIDFVDKRASVQRNSLAVQALLNNNIYLQETAGRNSALFGYSMGGLVARHALLDIESDDRVHNVGAYVSLDAPHRGAFLPPTLEAFARTTLALSGGGIGEFINHGLLREDLRAAVQTLDSHAARQLLGLYLGKGGAKPFKETFTGDERTQRWLNIEKEYIAMKGNNDLAKDPMYYSLREELIDMGGYPSRSLNIGVSFGFADGTRHMEPEERAGQPLSFKIDQGVLEYMNVDMRSIRSGHLLCRVKLLSRSIRTCPGFLLNGQHLESVFVSPGSTVETFGRAFSEAIGNDNTIINEDLINVGTGVGIASLGLGVGTSIGVAASLFNTNVSTNYVETEDFTTFIPMVSAFDDRGFARDYPFSSPLGALQTPFDAVIADTTAFPFDVRMHPPEHDMIRNAVITDIFDLFVDEDVFNVQKSRIGNSQTAGSPSSSYFDSAGEFDVARYVTTTGRDLPVATSESVMALLGPTKSESAKIVAALTVQ